LKFAPSIVGALAGAAEKMMTLVWLTLIVMFGFASMAVSMLGNLCILGDESLQVPAHADVC
jgi:hypothetical protein